MARDFANTAGSPNIDYITYSAIPPVEGLGVCSIVARLAGDSDAPANGNFFQATDASTNNSVAISRAVSTNVLYFVFRNAGQGVFSIPFTFNGAMRSVVASWDGSASPKCTAYLDGVAQTVTVLAGANTTIGTGMTGCAIGGVTARWNGRGADVALYNRVITPSEALMHAAGYSTNHFPRGRIFYAPLIREVHDIVGGLTGTITGTTVSDHPRIYA